MKSDFINVASVSPRVVSGDILENTNNICLMISELEKQDIQLAVFPELSITGYSCGDLILNTGFLKKAENALGQIVRSLAGMDIFVLVGIPLIYNSKLYNCATVVSRDGIHGIVPKTYIPNYREFYEARWYSTGSDIAPGSTIEIDGNQIPFEPQLIFKDVQNNVRFGIEICEDLWGPIPVSSHIALKGAHIIFNLSASNELIGKKEYRRELVSHQSAACVCAYVYSSCNLGDSSAELVYSGHKIISELGKTLAETRSFSPENSYITASVDIGAVQAERLYNSTFHGVEASRLVEISIKPKAPNLNSRNITATPFVPTDKEKRAAACGEVMDLLSTALAKKLVSVGKLRPVIGVSGGLDSSLALLVAQKACSLIDVPSSQIIAISMPGFGTSPGTFMNAKNLVHAIGAEYTEIDIKKICDPMFGAIQHKKSDLSVTFENIQARTRTSILMNYANKHGGFVLGTGDLSEAALGWCTYNGDHMSMYNINASVPKTLIRSLIKNISINSEQGLQKTLIRILETPISPELLPPNSNGEIEQLTEEKLGDYKIHDFILFYLLRYNFSSKKIRFLADYAFKDMFTKVELDKAFKVFYERFISSQFKRSTSPEGPKIGTISLSPRGDWRLPSDVSTTALD